MKPLLALAILASVAGITVWMVHMGRRDYRELRHDPDPAAPLTMMVRAYLGGALLCAPLLAFFWLEPPALSWVVTIYLVAVIAVPGAGLLLRRQAQSTGPTANDD